MNYLMEGAETDRLKFRKLTEADMAVWQAFYEDPTSTAYWNEPNSNPKIACCKWFEATFQRYDNRLGGMNALIHKQSGMVIGQCGLLLQTMDDRKELEIGYAMLPEFRNQGYASEAAECCKNYAFTQHWATSLISIIHIANLPSQNVAKKLGMFLDKTTTYKDNPVHIFRVLA
ncbi:GNAT family N-acetyltransferase [Arenibacter sp. GZD96]|uniref:GNAT family N-acetyltransferase n=1 Tax=Aurantibrevibacter litoralis TaxID=3106030 RepID=UPI002AFF24B1|nr:GNAT family N-acetyltransferase [Arenibacter sp. GZD-96]MEA1785116.1 GNAT family N-acetyltransferase [Arenibacter sp. GZD-96]